MLPLTGDIHIFEATNFVVYILVGKDNTLETKYQTEELWQAKK